MTDFYYIITWAFWLIVLGFISLPITTLFFSRFFDNGYGFTKSLTVISTSYVVFLLSIGKLAPFSRELIFITLTTYFLLNVFVYTKKKGVINNILTKNYRLFIFEEMLFLAGLVLWTFVRAHQPDINGLEKLMDYGFVNSTLQAKFLPPVDMWASGMPVNYYWFGHYITAFIIKLTGVQSGVGYNLMLGTILALSLSGSFSLTSSLVWNVFGKRFKSAAIIGGIISAILLNFAGNFHSPYFILKDGVDKYWYPDATRFIGYNPDVPDKTIHEFPIYSYVVSDLHAHLLNLPYVILFLALLYSFTLDEPDKKEGKKHWNFLYKTRLASLGLLIGIMFMTNAWDFANYLLVSGFVFLLSKDFTFNKVFTFKNIYRISQSLVVIMLVAFVAVLPFVKHFQSIAQGVAFTHSKSPFWQLAILWGFPLFLTSVFVIKNVLLKDKSKENMFVSAILISSWLLVVIPEFIYVKDIYAATHYRANTMFKLTYQAYVMFYLSSGYVVVGLIKTINNIWIKILIVLSTSVIFTSILYYPFLATKSYYGKVFSKDEVIKPLSGDGWIKEKYPDTFEIISWFRKNVSEQSVILEAPGDSYTDYNMISSYTGLQTVSGWYVHEWLWRGTPEFPQGRVNDISQIYTTNDSLVAKSLLSKYSVKYVIVGTFETEKFPELSEKKFSDIGSVVFSTTTSRVYKID